MLLLPLIENSFKHGINGDITGTFINIIIEQHKKYFSFFIENNFSEIISKDSKDIGGLGLKNIQQNLALMYPKNHSFSTNIIDEKFQVSLKINTYEY